MNQICEIVQGKNIEFAHKLSSERNKNSSSNQSDSVKNSSEQKNKNESDNDKTEGTKETHTYYDYQILYQSEKKLSASLKKQLEIEKIKIQQYMNTNGKIRGKLCPKCLQQTEDSDSRKHSDTEDEKSLSNLFYKRQNQKKNQNVQEKIQSKKQKEKSFSIFSNFTVFGLKESALQNYAEQQGRGYLRPELLYSFNAPTQVDLQSSELVFPSGAAVKKLPPSKVKDKAIQVMSCCYTNIKSFILRFKCQQNSINEKQYERDDFLMHINPQKQLFSLCVGVHDYTSTEHEERSSLKMNYPLNDGQRKENQGQNQNELSIQEKKECEDPPSQLSTKTISSISWQGPIDGIVSQRVFCITSYYPFFTFFEQILRNFINIVKMERLTIFNHHHENMKVSDSSFQLKRMRELFQSLAKNLNPKSIFFNRSYSARLINRQKIALITDWQLAKNYFVIEWVYSVLCMFSLDTFIEVFIRLMLEDHLVFVCENSHILTYTIYLFVSILTKPFMYAFEVVTIIPKEQFLGSPIPIVYGMLRRKKYMEENQLLEHYPDNTYVFLNPDKAEILSPTRDKEFHRYRPAKLKNDLSPLFKQIKKLRKSVIKAAKYEIQVPEYILSSTKGEKQLSIQILDIVNEYLLRNVVNKLPNQHEIQKLKNSIDSKQLPEEKDESSYLMQQIASELRKANKDPFFDRFLDTQMMNNYIFR